MSIVHFHIAILFNQPCFRLLSIDKMASSIPNPFIPTLAGLSLSLALVSKNVLGVLQVSFPQGAFGGYKKSYKFTYRFATLPSLASLASRAAGAQFCGVSAEEKT